MIIRKRYQSVSPQRIPQRIRKRNFPKNSPTNPRLIPQRTPQRIPQRFAQQIPQRIPQRCLNVLRCTEQTLSRESQTGRVKAYSTLRCEPINLRIHLLQINSFPVLSTTDLCPVRHADRQICASACLLYRSSIQSQVTTC